jgi:hypothetical protein
MVATAYNKIRQEDGDMKAHTQPDTEGKMVYDKDKLQD